MTQNSLIPSDITNTGLSTDQNEQLFSQITSGGYLPRLQLCGSGSDLCKEGKIGIARYAFVIAKDNFIDLGPEVNTLVLAWRPRALDMNNGQVLSVYDVNSTEFKRIQEKSKIQNSRCMFGPDFLVYVPAIKKFASFFMGSPTARREAPQVKALIGNAATLKARLIKNNEYSWHGPVCVQCSQPLDIPEMDLIKSEIEKFRNQKEVEVETAPETSDRA